MISFPFNTVVMIILAISLRKDSPIKFVFVRTYPEEHLYKYLKRSAKTIKRQDVP